MPVRRLLFINEPSSRSRRSCLLMILIKRASARPGADAPAPKEINYFSWKLNPVSSLTRLASLIRRRSSSSTSIVRGRGKGEENKIVPEDSRHF